MRIQTRQEARLACKIINNRVSLRVDIEDVLLQNLSRLWREVDPFSEMDNNARKHVYGRIERHRQLMGQVRA